MLVNFFVKVALLLLYLLFLVVLLRLLDLSVWYESGLLATQLVDPLSLSVRKLKLLLEGRGLSYDGVLEREELVHLAESSGEIAEGELGLLERKPESSVRQHKSVDFSGRAHFLEEVEDKKDSVWLVQVVPGAATPLLGSSVWKSVVEKVSLFGIRSGTFICARDIQFCRAKGWTKQPFILLAMPDGQQYKDHIVSRHLYQSTRASVVVDWVNHQLSSKLTEIQTEEDVCNHWLEFKSDEETSQSVRTVIFTPYERPSVLFSTLSMQYSGRVRFGYYRGRIPKCINLKPDAKTHLIVSTPSGSHIYGHRKGEFLIMDSLNLYFHTLVPEINDIFIMTFVAINIFCFMDLFLTPGGLAKVFLSFFWQLAKLNLLLILLWLPLLWVFQLPLMVQLSNFVWWGLQVLCQTGFAGQLRQDWLLYSHHWKVACGFFTLHCLLFGCFFKKCRPQSQEDNLSSVEWLRLIFHQLHLFMIRPRTGLLHGGPQISTNLEEGLDLFVERPTPDLWLHPVITGEYIYNLSQWKYEGSQKPSCPEKYGLKDLCCHCQTSLQKLFDCTKVDGDHGNRSQEMFQRSCREIHQIFSGVSTTTKEVNAVSDLGTIGYSWEGATNDLVMEDDVVVKQPMGDKSGNRPDANSFCQECMEVICQVGGEVKRAPPVLDLPNKSSLTPEKKSSGDSWPEDILRSSECAICLEVYVSGVQLCGLPCGHAFHFDCVQVWLCGGKHCCPTCRWPAFKKKPGKLSKYKE